MVEYWRVRLRFGIAYIEVIELVREAAAAYEQGSVGASVRLTRRAYQMTVGMLTAFAKVSRNASDRGAVATMDEYLYRYLGRKVEDLEAEAAG